MHSPHANITQKQAKTMKRSPHSRLDTPAKPGHLELTSRRNPIQKVTLGWRSTQEIATAVLTDAECAGTSRNKTLIKVIFSVIQDDPDATLPAIMFTYSKRKDPASALPVKLTAVMTEERVICIKTYAQAQQQSVQATLNSILEAHYQI